MSGNNNSNISNSGKGVLNGYSNNQYQQLDPLICRQNSANSNSLSKKLLTIKPPNSLHPTGNAINSQILNANINNTNTAGNHVYSQLQLRSDELDRVKTHGSSSSSSNQNSKPTNSSAAAAASSSLLHLSEFLKNTSTKTRSMHQPSEQYSNDDISLINLNKKSANYNGMNNSFEFNTSNAAGAIGSGANNGSTKVNSDYQRVNLPSSQTQRKVFLQKSESDSSIKQSKNAQDSNATESNQQGNFTTKILKVNWNFLIFSKPNMYFSLF